jgi:hypothetical protein
VMRFQLREYRIEDGRLDDFVREWREGVLPLRVDAGFSVIGPWLEREESLFVWIIGYDGDIRSAEEAYHASWERSALSPEPGRLVAERRDVWLEAPA